MTELMSNNAVYRTAPDTPGLLKKADDNKATLEGESATDIRGANVGEDAQDLEEGAAALEIVDGAEALEHESKQEIPPISDVSSERLLGEILKQKQIMIFQQKAKHEA